MNRIKEWLRRENYKLLLKKQNRSEHEERLLEQWSKVYGKTDDS